jgi:uncharacterized membrane protein
MNQLWSQRRWLFAILLLAALLRMANLSAKSFWLDEAYGVVRAQPGLVAVDSNNAPLYYTALYYWTDTFGRNEGIARLPSALISLLNVALLYQLGRQLLTPRVALLATALLAFSPLNIWYAQEARMYTPLVFCALLMALGLSIRHWAGTLLYLAGLTLGLYVGYLAFPLWIGISVLWLVVWWRRGHHPRPLLLWLLASAAGWLLYQPWWTYFNGWLQNSLLGHWMFAPVRNALGVERLMTWHFLVALAGAALLLLAAAAVAPYVLRQQRWRRLITVGAVAAFVLWLILVPVPRLYGLKRVIVTGWPFTILFVAWLLSNVERWQRPLVRALLALSLITAVATLLVPKDDWRSATNYIKQNTDSSSRFVWVDPPWNQMPLRYYDTEVAFPGGELEELKELAPETSDIWFVAERFHGRPAPSSPSEQWLNQNWELVETRSFYRLEVRHYRQPGLANLHSGTSLPYNVIASGK